MSNNPVLTGSHVERQQFFPGQRLLAEDLQHLEAFHRGMRELHNASLHQAGIGNGFAVSGEPGERELTIGPGYALDADGHEIVLTRAHTEQVPPIAAEDDGSSVWYDLTVSYPSDSQLEEAETRDGVCLPRGVVRLREEPLFCWVRLVRDEVDKLHPRDARLGKEIQSGRKIRLARVEVQNCELKSLSIAQRRNARLATQPYIACGEWQPQWVQQDFPLLLEAKVDTGSAQFQNTPCYTAHLQGPRMLDFDVSIQGKSVTVQFLCEGLLSIHDPEPDSFLVQAFVLVIPTDRIGWPYFLRPHEVIAPWKIVWMGVE